MEKNIITNINYPNNRYNYSYKNNNYNHRHKNLTESSYIEMQKALRKNYFNRLQSISLNKMPNYIYDDENKDIHKNLEEMNERHTKFAAKQIMFSNRVRKDNYSKIKKGPKKILYNESLPQLSTPMEILNNDINDNKREYMANMDAKENRYRKSPLPVIKKNIIDKSPLYYDLNYIDDVENKYIKPFLSNNNVKYFEYIKNTKSKAPFNFIIG